MFMQVLWLALAIVSQYRQLSCCASSPKPIVVPPTQYWDGNDGPWSTFWTRIGTPPQQIRLLPSTSGNAIWPVLPEGCKPTDPADCAEQRGLLFQSNGSSSWDEIGLYQLGLPNEKVLGYSGNSSFGYDNAIFGQRGQDLPVVKNQVIEGIATKDFLVGTIGLSPNAINISTFENSSASLLSSLKEQQAIPSLSWAYTAGSRWRGRTAWGSLTLGGYNSSRFVPNDVTFDFNPEVNRELLVGVQRISSNASSDALLSEGIYAYMDSLVPQLWLPEQVCKAFEVAFRLIYNSTADRYFVNQTAHSWLKTKNPIVTITLGQESSGGKIVNITMPYGNFDLEDYDIANKRNKLRSFPLRRANETTQYILGRAFFQDAYVIADYEQATFSVSQARFPTVSSTQQIVAILPPGGNTSDLSSGVSKNYKSRKLRPGIVVAIVFTTLIVVTLVVIALLLRRRHISRKRRAFEEAVKARHVALQSKRIATKRNTLSGSDRFEKSGQPRHVWPHELYDSDRRLIETHAGHDRPELQGNSFRPELRGASIFNNKNYRATNVVHKSYGRSPRTRGLLSQEIPRAELRGGSISVNGRFAADDKVSSESSKSRDRRGTYNSGKGKPVGALISRENEVAGARVVSSESSNSQSTQSKGLREGFRRERAYLRSASVGGEADMAAAYDISSETYQSPTTREQSRREAMITPLSPDFVRKR